jgi:outer membrane receptor protein involved in Fe transport
MVQAQKQDETIVLDEIVVSSKEGQELKKIPASVSVLSSATIEKERISGMRGLSAFVPNLFIPDYGSKYTSAIYIRGIGARMGNSAVGMYVDNVPYLDKTSFDFDFFDIKRVEVLRGPQGTLYGRNSMGGLINIYTLSPWDYQGTRLKLSSGSYGLMRVQLSHYAKLSERFAFSLGGNYSATGGAFENQNPYNPGYFNFGSIIFPSMYKENNVEATQSVSLRANTSWRPSEKLSFNYIGSYEYTNQSGYAYGKYNFATNLPDTINYNDPAYYCRNVLNNSLRIEYQGKNFKIASTTGHQFLSDSLLLDQDFSPASMFTLFQSQRLNAINQEITIRSTGASDFQWIGGVSGFFQNLNTGSLVTFRKDGIAFIQDNINSSGMPFPLTISNETIPVVGEYITKNHGFAAFLQPTLNNFLIEGLSVSTGIRLDYEHASLKHFTNSVFDCLIQMGVITLPYSKNDSINGAEKMDFTQLLPKFSVRYEKNGNIAYASVSKGYKAGGYNLQMFSDLIETKMRTSQPPVVPLDIQKSTSFRPEYSWNYEVGGRISFLDNKINLGMTLFLLDIRDQQIVEFAPNGQGRMIKNAGESQSKGIEFEADIHPLRCFTVGFSYGFTENKFTEYREQTSETSFVDYSGKYVPFVPKQTVSLTAVYTLHFKNSFIDRLLINGRYSGAGKIYWTEANDVSQKFYSLLNGRISVEKGDFSLGFRVENLLDSKYTTFYFKTFGNSFGQPGKPVCFGIDLNTRF